MRPELWSSPEAVYALITFDVNLWADAIGETLYRNDGTGWVSIHEITSTAQADTRLANAVVGLSTGSVALVGGECPVLMVDSAGASSCALAEPVRPIAAAGADDRLYILADDETETARSLMELAGGTWRTILTLTPQEMGVALAVNGDTVVLAGQTLRAGSVTAGTVVPLPNIPALLYGDVWLVSPNELVARDTVGQLVRFDGVQWTIVDSGTGDRITGIWGAPDGAVYFVTQHQFGRLVGDQVTLFTTPEANDANHYFADIWGNSSSEVFVAVNDRDYDIYECGVSFLLWFDGVQLHEF